MNDPYLSLHEVVLAVVPGAEAALCEKIIVPLQRNVVRRYPTLAQRRPDLIDDAVHTALLGYLRAPERFDPARSSLLHYLSIIAHRDLLSLEQRERRHSRHEVPLAQREQGAQANQTDVSIDDFAGNDDVEAEVIRRFSDATVQRALLRLFPDPQDRQMLDLLLNRERATEPYAVILGITDAPLGEQQKTVNQHKNRLRMRLRRNIDQLRPEADI